MAMASFKNLHYSVLLGNFFLMTYFTFLGTSLKFHFTENTSQNLIFTTCNHTLYYDICVSSLKSNPLSEKADVEGLANIAVNVSIAYGEQTLAYIGDLKSKTRVNETISSCLADCAEQYNDAIENLKEAIGALGIRSLETLNTLVSSAMTDSETCEEGFEEMLQNDKYGSSPLADRNLYFSKLCSNFLAITTLFSL